jgi:hypothetical protein
MKDAPSAAEFVDRIFTVYPGLLPSREEVAGGICLVLMNIAIQFSVAAWRCFIRKVERGEIEAPRRAADLAPWLRGHLVTAGDEVEQLLLQMHRQQRELTGLVKSLDFQMPVVVPDRLRGVRFRGRKQAVQSRPVRTPESDRIRWARLQEIQAEAEQVYKALGHDDGA